MKPFAQLRFLGWLTLFYFLASCQQQEDLTIDVLQIEGATWACNITTTFGTFGASAESEEASELYLPVSPGDLIYVLLEELELYYRYQPENGKHLKVTGDTATYSVFINDQLKYLELSDKASSWKVLENLSEAEITQLSVLRILDPPTLETLEILRSHDHEVQGKGVILEADTDPQILQELLSICRPLWLMMESPLEMIESPSNASLYNLELLWVTNEIQTLTHVARCCPALETLIVSAWDPLPGELLALSEQKNLKTLVLAECGLPDLSSLQVPNTLQSLHLIDCDTLSDIQGMLELTALQSIGLSGSDHVASLELLASFPSLKRISLPENISQPLFNEIVVALPSLKAIELIGCSQVTDLSALQESALLKFFSSDQEMDGMNGLDLLNQLDLILLNSNHFEDHPERIGQLRSSLPETNIVPGSGLCLGSGWLLLLLPALLISRILFRKKRTQILHW